MRKRLAAIAGVTMFAAALVAPSVATAAAASTSGPKPVPCTTVVHTDLSTVKTDNDSTPVVQTTATDQLLPFGVKITTPDVPSKAYARFNIGAAFPLASVTKTSYKTYMYANSGSPIVLPSYEIEAYTLGGTAGYTTLVSEPYQAFGTPAIHTGQWQTWNPLSGKWWSSRVLTINGVSVPAQTPFAWSDFLSSYKNAVGFDYDVNQGTNNPGAITAFNDLTFGTTSVCAEQAWTSIKPKPTPSPSGCGCAVPPSPSPSTSPSGCACPKPSSSSSAPAAPSSSAAPAHSSAAPVGGGGAGGSSGNLPTTGSSLTIPISVGLAMVLFGGGLLFFVRRRRGVHSGPVRG
jgi:LPXTG-motif cell wall-anchored protein